MEVTVIKQTYIMPRLIRIDRMPILKNSSYIEKNTTLCSASCRSVTTFPPAHTSLMLPELPSTSTGDDLAGLYRTESSSGISVFQQHGRKPVVYATPASSQLPLWIDGNKSLVAFAALLLYFQHAAWPCRIAQATRWTIKDYLCWHR
ncbi:Exodeoxyribonuclease 7 large subunit [Trichinella spiralis]|uniref:Exodeoxyribonuclease 7 large subunit n=1 Tax=Trichinella spiralis TaxID=6334 RepID=A0ABR3KA71_TRISP